MFWNSRLLLWVYIHVVFISIKTTSPPKGNLKGWRPCWDFWCMHTPRWRNVYFVIFFFRSHEPNLHSWIKWAFHFQMSIIVFIINILCASQRILGDRNLHKAFSALNFAIILIKSFTSNLITQTFQYPFQMLNGTLIFH